MVLSEFPADASAQAANARDEDKNQASRSHTGRLRDLRVGLHHWCRQARFIKEQRLADHNDSTGIGDSLRSDGSRSTRIYRSTLADTTQLIGLKRVAMLLLLREARVVHVVRASSPLHVCGTEISVHASLHATATHTAHDGRTEVAVTHLDRAHDATVLRARLAVAVSGTPIAVVAKRRRRGAGCRRCTRGRGSRAARRRRRALRQGARGRCRRGLRRCRSHRYGRS
mmetsp:Transcript_80808/g.232164  ORF Transcript_80808/g.232164 Transcript_80808/m.232164 type:complete len:227 (+) Transcript_80808:1015-1695(+)